jgi:hypothetical protein
VDSNKDNEEIEGLGSKIPDWLLLHRSRRNPVNNPVSNHDLYRLSSPIINIHHCTQSDRHCFLDIVPEFTRSSILYCVENMVAARSGLASAISTRSDKDDSASIYDGLW